MSAGSAGASGATGGSGGASRAEASDEELVAMVLDGDREAFAGIVRRHQGKVFRLGLGFFKDPDDAADFVQDVMIKAYRHLASFKGRSRFSTWLYRVAWNAAAQAKRRKPRYEPLETDPEDASRYSAEELVLRSEAAAALRAAMAELPERYAACVDLYFYHELSFAEIGEVTGFPVNTIKSHVFRAKKQLRTALEGPEERR